MTAAGLAALAGDLLSDADDARRASVLSAAAGGDAAGIAATLELARLIGEASDPAEAFAAGEAMSAPDATAMAARLTLCCFAACRTHLPARQDAAALRARVAAVAEAAYAIVGAAGADVLSFAVAIAGATVRHLSMVAASRAPVVRVETGLSLPASLVAWDLYGDPARGAEIVARNGSATPMLMPAVFEALAS